MEKSELVVLALQERIGQLVANYETQLAIYRAEITQLTDEKNAKEKAIEEYSKSLEGTNGNI